METEEETVQTKPSAGQICPLMQRQPEEEEAPEEEEEPIQAKQAGGQTAHVGPGLQAQIDSMRGGGQPLPDSARNFFEPRFGHDFSGVRVHTGSQAAKASRAINARAFTIGKNVVFGEGQSTPGTTAGKKLLAHELAHVVQQASNVTGSRSDRFAYCISDNNSGVINNVSSTDVSIQRACGSAAIGQPTGCTFNDREVTFPRYLFKINCDVFRRGNEEDLRRDAAKIANGETVEIHGLASMDGDPTFNRNLSCARALEAKRVIESVLAKRGITATLLVYFHGPTPGDPLQQRSVVVYRSAPSPPTPPTPPAPPTRPTPPAPPLAAGPFLDLQIACVIDNGGCTNPATIPTLDRQCRNQTGYAGAPVILSDLICSFPGLGIAASLSRAYPRWLTVLHTRYPCPCTRADARSHPNFSYDLGSLLPGHHPGSDACYRSDSIASVTGTQHGQQCCYLNTGALITIGPGAGTPDVWHWLDSYRNHQRIDYQSYIDLNRNWLIYNMFWIPDKGVSCGP